MRQYLRSKTPRVRWTAQLHQSFLHAIRRLGGENKATPKLIVEIMGTDHLKTSHVKSHLQMYRNMKKCEKCPEHMQENYNLDRFEKYSSRGNIDEHSPFSELEQESEINQDLSLYANKRNSIATSSQYENGHATTWNNKLFETRLDAKKLHRKPKSKPPEYRTQHLVHIMSKQLQYTPRKKEKHQLNLFKQELESSLYHHHRMLCSPGTSKQKRRPILEQDQIISCNSSIDSDSALVLNGTRCDTDGKRPESTEGNGVRMVEKRILREEDIRLELSISIC